jgi:hypothetical protein
MFHTTGDNERSAALLDDEILDQSGEAIGMIRMRVSHDNMGEAGGVTPCSLELLKWAPAAINQEQLLLA